MNSSRNPWLLGYPDYDHYFNLDYKQVDYPTFEEGLAAIARQISEGQLVIVSGTSYFLPYSKDYRNHAYIKNYPHPIFGVGDHVLAVTCLSEEQVWVFDPVPDKFFGPITMNDFAGFWRGNRSIPELQAVPGIEKLHIFGNGQLFTGKKLNADELEELSWAITKTIVFEFLKGTRLMDNDCTYYFGKQAAIQLREDFLKAVAEDSCDAAAMAFKLCFMEQRFPRYHFRDLLKDLTSLYKLPERYLNEYAEVVKKWELMGSLFMLDAARGENSGKMLEETVKRIDEAIGFEINFQENFSNTLESFSASKIANGAKLKLPLF